MKYSLKLIGLLIIISILAFTGCEDRTSLTKPQAPNTGDADFTRFVTIGNSLTAGYQNGSLYESAQEYSFGNLIARQVYSDYEQPIFDETGTTGKMSLASLEPLVIDISSTSGNPLNLNYPAPYNNLGVPGAYLWDVLNATDSSDCYTATYFGATNPLFDAVLRNSALNKGSQFAQASALNPTFVSLWIGNNDILGYATSGATLPPYTDEITFAGLYGQIADTLSTRNADVILANIPSITSIPFFTTIGPQLGNGLKQAMAMPGVECLFYQKHGETVATGLADTLDLWTNSILITLSGSTYAPLLGQPTGQYYTDNNIPIPAGIDTTQAFALHPQNPWPDALVLDQTEIADIGNIIGNYNSTIENLANSYNYALVDVNSFFSNIADNGYSVNGLNFSTAYIEGGLFSLDGVHPTSRGYAIIANEFIEEINDFYNANIPLINVSSIPGSIPLTGE